MKLISIEQTLRTSVLIEKAGKVYYVSVDNWSDKIESFENTSPRKIRKDSKLHKILSAFALNKIAEQA